MKYKILFGFWLIMAVAVTASFAQTALKLPKKLINFEQRVSTMEKLSDGEKTDLPWVVYSDRGDDFGEKYFVTEEKATQVHIFKASGCNASTRKLTDPADMGWREKKELFVHFGAEFTAESMIHKKCVILNSPEVVDKIDAGEMSESEIPLYNSPDSKKSIGNVPLYYIYFVYKTDVDNNRFLLGKNFRCDVNSFKDQILGWVDKSRVHEYNTRICFEPNYDEKAVAFRRCNPMYSAKVFNRSDQALNFQKGDTSYKHLWIEPTTFFFRNPEKGKKELNLPFNGETLPDSLISKLCGFPNMEKLKEAKILTGKPLPGYKFRFPLIDIDKKSDDIFMVGVAGRLVNQALTDKTNCDDLKRNRRKLNFYFLLDNSIDRNKLSFALGQIEQGYTEFDKTYGVCFYPRTFMKHKIALGEVDPKNNSSNYSYTRDFISGYIADKSVIQGDNYIKALKNILENQNFETTKTNIIVIINNGKVANAEFANIKDDIEAQLVAKNCFIIAYDYSRDNSFNTQIQQIMVSANSLFAEKSGFPNQKATFVNDNGVELMYSYLLLASAQKSENSLGAVQMEKLLGNASQKIISTVDNYINLLCGQTTQNNTGVRVNREDPFVRGQSALMAKNSKIQYIRLLEKGYSPMKYKLPVGLDGNFPVWKTDVLFTKEELQYIASSIDKLAINQNNSDFSKSLYDLYVGLFNRFVGDEIPIDQLRERTPQQIMSDIVGGTFGYDVTEPIKRYTLGRILSNDQEMQGMFDSFKRKLQEKRNNISRIINENELIFCLDGDNCGSDQKQTGKGIYYYWIPIDILP
ncbi:MAG: hypothetical protein ACOYN4_01675 [Bacteroidales bacterium]